MCTCRAEVSTGYFGLPPHGVHMVVRNPPLYTQHLNMHLFPETPIHISEQIAALATPDLRWRRPTKVVTDQ